MQPTLSYGTKSPHPEVLRSIEETAELWRTATSARLRRHYEQCLVDLFLQAWTLDEYAGVRLLKCFPAAGDDWLAALPWARERGLPQWAARKKLKPPEQWRRGDVVDNLKRFFRDEHDRLKLEDGCPVTLWYGIEETKQASHGTRNLTSIR